MKFYRFEITADFLTSDKTKEDIEDRLMDAFEGCGNVAMSWKVAEEEVDEEDIEC